MALLGFLSEAEVDDLVADAVLGGSGVASFNTRTAAVTLTSADVTTALTFTPLNATAYTAADVLTKLLTVDGAASGLDADLLDGNSSAFYLAASAYTAADVFAKVLTLDGAGSGLDADLLDGSSSAAFAAASHEHSATDLTSGIVPDARMPNLTGDATTVEGAVAVTFATVNANVGTYGSATKASIVTVNAKGLVTAASEATVTPAWGSVSGTPTTLGGYGITDAQALDADLTTIAGLTATTGNFIVSVSSAWASRTPAQVRTTLALVIGTDVQAWAANLDEYAAVNPTAAGLALLDDADASAQRTTLGLGTAAIVNTGTSGATLGLLSTANTWGAYQYFGVGARVDGSSSPASGEGIEFSYTGGAGAIYAYDRTGGAYKAMTYGGLTVTLQVNGTNIAAPTATGFEPATDNTFYLGLNNDDSPKAWKGLILKDQAGTGKYYRLEVNNNALLLVDLTD